MAIQNTRFTPARRGPTLSGADRPASRLRDPVLRKVGHRTEDIRLTPAGTDVSAGEGAFYNCGKVDKLSVGRYRLTRQDAASATAEPLGDFDWCEFDIFENTAGVFVAQLVSNLDVEGGTATSDADDTNTEQSAAVITAVTDPDISGAGSDSRITAFVHRAADVTDFAGATAPYTPAPAVDDLIILDAEANATHVMTLTRIA